MLMNFGLCIVTLVLALRPLHVTDAQMIPFTNINDTDTASMPPLLDGVGLYGKIFNAHGSAIGDLLPYPMPHDHMVKLGLTSDIIDSMHHVRLIATRSLPVGQEPDSLGELSDHRELRAGDRLKIVLWTAERIYDPSTSILVQSAQSFLQQAFGLYGGRPAASATIPVQLSDMFIPADILEFEIEIVTVPSSQFYRRPICQIASSTVGDLPCPSMIVTEDSHLQSLISQKIVSSLDRFISDTTESIFDGVDKAEIYGWSVDSEWFGVPLYQDTRLLAFSRSTFERLKMKLPPPYDDWGLMWSDWTWERVAEYAEKLRQNGVDGFRFGGDVDEENKLFQMMARSVGGHASEAESTCGLADPAVTALLQSTIGKLFQASDPPFVVKSGAYAEWEEAPLNDPLIKYRSVPGSKINAKTNGLAYVDSGSIQNGITADGKFSLTPDEADILPAYMPGFSSMIGGSLSIISGSLSPSFAWAFASFTVSSRHNFVSKFAAVKATPEPYYRRDAPSIYPISGEQLSKSEPFNAPYATFPYGDRFVSYAPFRMFLLEVVYKSQSVSDAISRSCTRLSALALPPCRNVALDIIATRCDPARDYRKILFTGRELIVSNLCTVEDSLVASIAESQDCGHIETKSSFGITMIVFAVISLLFIMGISVVTMMRRNNGWISSVSVTCGPILLGAFLLSISIFGNVGAPTKASCTSQVFLVAFGVVGFAMSLVFAAFLIKYGQIGLMVNEKRFTSLLVSIAALHLLVLIIWASISNGPGVKDMILEVIDEANGNNIRVLTPTCSYGSSAALAFLAIVDILLAIAGFIFAIMNRNVLVGYREPKYLVFMLSLVLGLAFILLPFVSFSTEVPVRIFVMDLFIFFGLMVGVGVYFIPKIRDSRRPGKRKSSVDSSLNQQQAKQIPVKRQSSRVSRVASLLGFPYGNRDSYTTASSTDSIFGVDPDPLSKSATASLNRDSPRRAWNPVVSRSPVNTRRTESMYHSFNNAHISDIQSVISFHEGTQDGEEDREASSLNNDDFDLFQRSLQNKPEGGRMMNSIVREDLESVADSYYDEGTEVEDKMRSNVSSVIVEEPEELSKRTGWYRNSFMDMISDSEPATPGI